MLGKQLLRSLVRVVAYLYWPSCSIIIPWENWHPCIRVSWHCFLLPLAAPHSHLTMQSYQCNIMIQIILGWLHGPATWTGKLPSGLLRAATMTTSFTAKGSDGVLTRPCTVDVRPDHYIQATGRQLGPRPLCFSNTGLCHLT